MGGMAAFIVIFIFIMMATRSLESNGEVFNWNGTITQYGRTHHLLDFIAMVIIYISELLFVNFHICPF